METGLTSTADLVGHDVGERFAHWTNARKLFADAGFRGHVRITADMGGRISVASMYVKSKREARDIARQYGAQCWNF